MDTTESNLKSKSIQSQNLSKVAYVLEIPQFLAPTGNINSEELWIRDLFIPNGSLGKVTISKEVQASTEPALKLKFEIMPGEIYYNVCNHLRNCPSCETFPCTSSAPFEALQEISCRFRYYGYNCILNSENNWTQTVKIEEKEDYCHLEEKNGFEFLYVTLIMKDPHGPTQFHIQEHKDDVVGLQSLAEDLLQARSDGGDVAFVFQNDVDMEELSADGNSQWVNHSTPPEATLKAHKWLLMARSSVFRSLFNSGMQEAVTQQVLITDFNVQEFELFLQCLYHGKVPVRQSVDMYLALSRAAHKYDVSTIATAVRGVLIQLLSATNVFEIAQHAELYSDNALLDVATRFVVLHGAKIDETIMERFARNPKFAKMIMIAAKHCK